MKILERSYGGKIFRPRPEVYLNPTGSLCLVVTPWGPRSTAKKVVKFIQDHFHAIEQDAESTSPFARMTCLSPLANNLRIAVKIANDAIYHSENRNEYNSGFEIFALAKDKSEVAWLQVGFPIPLLVKKNHPPVPLGIGLDLSCEMSAGEQSLAPLPHKILGIDAFSDFTVESFRPQDNDQLLLLSKSHPSLEIIDKNTPMNLDMISKKLAHSKEDGAFWLGIIDF